MNVKYLIKSKTSSMKNTDKKQDIIKKLQDIFGDGKAEQIIKSITFNKPKTFRINRLKFTANDDLNEIKSHIKNADFSDSFISSEEIQISKTKLNGDKKIYIQELASMIPVVVLNPKTEENILDMCASPGSKTSMIQSLTNNKANVTAVEKSLGRFYKLKEIVTDQGCENVKFIHSDANYLIKKFPDFANSFDKVMLDAPCSNEGGIVLSEPSTYKYWSLKEGKQISKLQKGLLNSAGKLVKPRGEIIYSTCTFSVEENEEVVDWFLRRNPNFQLEAIDLKIENAQEGITKYKDKCFDSTVSKTLRIIPNERFKGFFVARLKRLQ